jgi:hypothetical protein
MKYHVALLALAAIAECVPQLGMSGAAWTFVGKKDAKPKYRSTAKREILKYGPLVLQAKDVSFKFNFQLKHCH